MLADCPWRPLAVTAASASAGGRAERSGLGGREGLRVGGRERGASEAPPAKRGRAGGGEGRGVRGGGERVV